MMADAVVRMPGIDVERSKTGPEVLEVAFFVEWELPGRGEATAVPMAIKSPCEGWGRLERAVGGRPEPE